MSAPVREVCPEHGRWVRQGGATRRCPECPGSEVRGELLARLEAAGKNRREARTMFRLSALELRRLAPRARDAGATVQEIADAYGVTRAGVYEAMKGGE